VCVCVCLIHSFFCDDDRFQRNILQNFVCKVCTKLVDSSFTVPDVPSCHSVSQQPGTRAPSKCRFHPRSIKFIHMNSSCVYCCLFLAAAAVVWSVMFWWAVASILFQKYGTTWVKIYPVVTCSAIFSANGPGKWIFVPTNRTN